MNRREFLLRSSLLAAAGALSPAWLRGQAGAATARGAFGEFKPLRRNAGVFTGRGGTIGWLMAPDARVIVDTQFPDTAATCLAGLPGRNGRPLDVVLNTHHHADHTSGNPVFRPVAHALVAQANVPHLQFEAAKRADREGKTSGTGSLERQVYADTTFPEVWRHEFADEVVTAQYFGAAHTSGDAVIMFERANVVHVGDLVFNRIYPVIDRLAGGTARGWIAVLDEVAKTYPTDAIYVFGHGNPRFGITGTHGDLKVMRDYWTAVIAHVQEALTTGKPRDEIVRLDNLAGFPDFHTPAPNRLTANLAAVYDELTAH